MLAIKLDADSILGLPGIGPKAVQAIQETLDSISFPEPEIPVELEKPVVEELPEPEVVAPTTEATPVVESELPPSNRWLFQWKKYPRLKSRKSMKKKKTSKNSSPFRM